MKPALLLAAVVLLTGCSGSSISDENGAAYVAEVRAAVTGASSYTDDQLLNMAKNVCSLDSVEQGVKVLDNYSGIAPEDRERVASIALSTACPPSA